MFDVANPIDKICIAYIDQSNGFAFLAKRLQKPVAIMPIVLYPIAFCCELCDGVRLEYGLQRPEVFALGIVCVCV